MVQRLMASHSFFILFDKKLFSKFSDRFGLYGRLIWYLLLKYICNNTLVNQREGWELYTSIKPEALLHFVFTLYVVIFLFK